MQIHLKRLHNNGQSTLGTLSINGEMVCFGLEDPHQDEKIPGKTRIPAGRYRIVPRRVGKFFKAYNADNERNHKRFGRRHPFALEIENVPGFTYIMIHTGMTHLHTEGCILTGLNLNTERTELRNSGIGYGRLFDLIETAVAAGECWILIEDETT